MKNIFIVTLLNFFLCSADLWADNADWTFDPYNFQYDMTVYACLEIDGNAATEQSRYTIAAFCGEDCRGVMENKSANGINYGYLRVRSNQIEGENITFKVYDNVTGYLMKCYDEFAFIAQDIVGLPSAPFVFHAHSRIMPPIFDYDGMSILALTPRTEGSDIHYRSTDAEGSFAYYIEPLRLADNRPVYAYASQEGYANSDTVFFVPDNFVCDSVELAYSEPWLTMRCHEDGAEIHYTLDGTEPTEDSPVYTRAIEITQPCMVTAVAYKKYKHPSRTAMYDIVQCYTPGIAFDGKTLSIGCETENAVVHFFIKEIMNDMAVYYEPIPIQHNFTATAYATKDGMISSRNASLSIDTFTVATPFLACDGRFVNITCADESTSVTVYANGTKAVVFEGMSNYISTDDLMKTAYEDGSVGELLVYAVASKPYMNESTSDEYRLPAYSRKVDDQLDAYVFIPGYMEFGTWWNMGYGDSVTRLNIHGRTGNGDERLIAAIDPLFLDMSDADSDVFPEFALSGAKSLAAVKWNDKTAVTNIGNDNPNLLFYCTDSSFAPNDVKNVIVNGRAQRITLQDSLYGITYGNFYCPESFTARKISYEHSYGMQTGKGFSQGWETIALPFDVQTVYHRTNHTEIVPIAVYNQMEEKALLKPFWLCVLTDNGWEQATSMEAYTPYIISMPNNDDYVPSFRLPGEVSFRAENVTVEATRQEGAKDYLLKPTMTRVNAANDVLAINKYTKWDENNEGSAFVSGLRDIRPFEAYILSDNTQRRIIRLSDWDNSETNNIEETDASSTPRLMYNLQGQAVDSNYKGIVIRNGQKMWNRK